MTLTNEGQTVEDLHLSTIQHQYRWCDDEYTPQPWNPYRHASFPHPVEEYLGLATRNRFVNFLSFNFGFASNVVALISTQ